MQAYTNAQSKLEHRHSCRLLSATANPDPTDREIFLSVLFVCLFVCLLIVGTSNPVSRSVKTSRGIIGNIFIIILPYV